MHCIDHPCILLVPNDEIASLSIPSLGTPSNDRLPSTVQPPTHLLLYMITTAAAADTKETRGGATTFRRKLLTMTHMRKKKPSAKGEPPTHRGLQLSELEAPTTHLQRSTKRCSRGFGRRGQWSIGAPGGAGTDDGCRFGVVSEFGRRIDADHLLGTCVAHRVALCQRASPNRPCVSFPLCAFFGGGRFVGPLRWLIDHRQTMESCSLNRLPLRFHIPDSRGSRVVFVLFTWS